MPVVLHFPCEGIGRTTRLPGGASAFRIAKIIAQALRVQLNGISRYFIFINGSERRTEAARGRRLAHAIHRMPSGGFHHPRSRGSRSITRGRGGRSH